MNLEWYYTFIVVAKYEKGIYEMRNSKKKYSFRLNVVVTSYIASYLPTYIFKESNSKNIRIIDSKYI